MARGSEAKQTITQKILKMFEGSFLYDKEIRVPIVENGELIQVKISLVAAKTNVENGSDNAIPMVKNEPFGNQNFEVTPQEKEETLDLIKTLNL